MKTGTDEIINSLETFRDLFDNASDLIHLVALDGEILYTNNAWQKILGYSQQQSRGKSLFDLIHEKDRELFYKYRSDVINGNDKGDKTLIRMIAANGATVYLEGFVSVRRQVGVPVYTRGIFRDVTVRIENEKQLAQLHHQLKEREENLRQLLFHAPDAVIAIDRQSVITYWNPKAEQMFGWTSEEAVGKSLADTIIPPQHREGHRRGMARYFETGITHVMNKTIDITALRKNGEEFYISLTISSTIQQGKEAFVAFLRDIDQEKKTELELEKKRAELETSNEDLEQFAHVTSHDMKEPIRKILVFGDRLKAELKEALPGKAQHYLDRIENAAARLSRMIDGILAYSSLGAGDEPFEQVDLNVVFNNVRGDLDLVIERQRATVTSDPLPVVEGIPVLLNQLFYNLIANSLKFARKDVDPVIHLSCSELPPANGEPVKYSLKLRDNGIGFKAEDAQRIFKRFARLHSQSEYEGTGLGLALCRKIVERHHGDIRAESSGEGAVFTIVLPGVQANTPGNR